MNCHGGKDWPALCNYPHNDRYFIRNAKFLSLFSRGVDMTDRVDISRLLSDMRTLKAQTQAFQRPDALRGAEPMANGMRNLGGATVNEATKVPSFGDLMTQAVNKVNDVQKTSSAMADAYERGIAGVDITDVMIASQKASVSFQAMVQVRNKLVEAYKEVMNMPI